MGSDIQGTGQTAQNWQQPQQQQGFPPLPYSVEGTMVANNAGGVPPAILAGVLSSETNGYNQGQAGFVPGELPPGGIGQVSLGEIADTYKRLSEQGNTEGMAALDKIIQNNSDIFPQGFENILKERASGSQQGEIDFLNAWPGITAKLTASGGNIMLEGQEAVDMVSLSLASLKGMNDGSTTWGGALTMYNAGVQGGAGLGDPDYLNKIGSYVDFDQYN